MTDPSIIMDSETFQRCESFHGHVCPGLCLGFKASRAAMAWLREQRAGDEELVAIVETDACSADAVQVLTGCTFGKGNFIFKDHGKMALTLLSRKSGRGVRVALRAGAFAPDAEHMALIRKIMEDSATDDERRRFQALHAARSEDVLRTPDDVLFTIAEAHLPLPARARMEPSEACARCGEPTMRAKMQMAGGVKVCRGCL